MVCMYYVLYLQWKKMVADIRPMLRFGLALTLCAACLFIQFSSLRAMMSARGAVGYVDVLFRQPQSVGDLEQRLRDHDIFPDAMAVFSINAQRTLALRGTYRQVQNVYGEALDTAKAYRDADVCWIDPALLPDTYLLDANRYSIWIEGTEVLVQGKQSAWIPEFMLDGAAKKTDSPRFFDSDHQPLRRAVGDQDADPNVVSVPITFFDRHQILADGMTLIFQSNQLQRIRDGIAVLTPLAQEFESNGLDFANILFDQGIVEGIVMLLGIVMAILCLLNLYDGWIRSYDTICARLHLVGYSRRTLYAATLIHTLLVLSTSLLIGMFIYRVLLPIGERNGWMKALDVQHFLVICGMILLSCYAMAGSVLHRQFRRMGGERVC